MDNFDRLYEYYLRFRKLNLPTEPAATRRKLNTIFSSLISIKSIHIDLFISWYEVTLESDVSRHDGTIEGQRTVKGE